MATNFIKKIFGDYSTRELKRVEPIKDSVLKLENKYAAMTDADLKSQTEILKKRLGEGETLDDILPDAFAVCREASWRTIGMKHFPVQIIGGIILHQGRIAEMKTGEGKTLVATLPVYLNALTEKGVHVVTVNDYLAKRDSEWMGKIYKFLGLTVGLIEHDKTNEERRKAYNCDITYGTNNELGFDYLRDNMVQYKENRVQRGHVFAVVDEIDSILIDEARTPLIISGEGEDSTDLYVKANEFAKKLEMVKVAEVDAKEDSELTYGGDFIVDEKARTAVLTRYGVKKAEQYFKVKNLMDLENITLLHHINQAIKAIGVMKRDIDYVVKDNEVLIVDEFTGRIMPGRRYNEGLHQAIEAKEGIEVQKESKTLATITFQNYFRLYDKISGMTGTASTESEEFREIYQLDIVTIPTNKEIQRIDCPDVIFQTEKGKFDNVIEKIKECYEKGQPVLVGTVSIEKSEKLSKLLKRAGIPHKVLNAKNHEKEAEIIAQAGKLNAVTIATNMAGRGTDIMLGGNSEYLAKSEMRKKGFDEELINEATGFAETDDEEIINARKIYQELEDKFKKDIKVEAEKVKEVGGLYIIGTERHESRRIDNQLRGRSGRQGDPGISQFYLSCEDDVMRLFGGERIQRILSQINDNEDIPIESKILSKTVENAQKNIEGKNFGARKNVIQYDDVINEQRKIIYEQRNQVLDDGDIQNKILKMLDNDIESTVSLYCPKGSKREEWNITSIKEKYSNWISLENKFDDINNLSLEDIVKTIKTKCCLHLDKKKQELGEDVFDAFERKMLLYNVDKYWMDYIDAIDEFKKGIHLRAYSQKDPVVTFRIESYDMFEEMTQDIKNETIRMIMTLVPKRKSDVERTSVAHVTSGSGSDGVISFSQIRRNKDLNPNGPCPCGSGKKYKKCHGAKQMNMS